MVGVIKNQRDLEILLNKGWYRIPKSHSPSRKFSYLAFYQPLEFGPGGKCIRYYAKVKSTKEVKRQDLLPDDIDHPRANDDYLKISVLRPIELSKPIYNIIPRRVTFGFTTLGRLKSANDILELYSIAPTEQIIEQGMIEAKIIFTPQFYEIMTNKKRFRLDFAVFCKSGKIAVECDNDKAHNQKFQQKRDASKDKILKSRGWQVLRFTENQILFDLKTCIATIKSEIAPLGGQVLA